jgi:N-acetylglutamate synthase-like GNAT family acetyltransferase
VGLLTGVTIRRARFADLERVRQLTVASKAHWGYDHDFVLRWAEGLTFSSPRERWVAEADGVIVAWAALVEPEDGVAVLDDLWVDPAQMRRRIGTRLFRIAAERARELGASRLEWGTEPNAVGFYEKVGGRYLRDRLTSWGREVPVMGIDL